MSLHSLIGKSGIYVAVVASLLLGASLQPTPAAASANCGFNTCSSAQHPYYCCHQFADPHRYCMKYTWDYCYYPITWDSQYLSTYDYWYCDDNAGVCVVYDPSGGGDH